MTPTAKAVRSSHHQRERYRRAYREFMARKGLISARQKRAWDRMAERRRKAQAVAA